MPAGNPGGYDAEGYAMQILAEQRGGGGRGAMDAGRMRQLAGAPDISMLNARNPTYSGVSPRGLGGGFPARLTPVGGPPVGMELGGLHALGREAAVNREMGNPAERALRLQELLAAGITSLAEAQRVAPYAPDKAKVDLDLSILAEYEMNRMMQSGAPGGPPAATMPGGQWSPGDWSGEASNPYRGFQGGIQQQGQPQGQQPQRQQPAPRAPAPVPAPRPVIPQSTLNALNPVPQQGIR